MSDRTRELECVISDLKQQVRDAEKVRDDLLEALQAIVATCSVRIDDPRITHFDAARRAIASATGESE